MQQAKADTVQEAIVNLRNLDDEADDQLNRLTLRQIELLTGALEKDPKMARKMAEMLGLVPG